MNVSEKSISILGYVITPTVAREVIQRASAVNWGTHLKVCMNIKELERLLQKYYGYVADLEGSGVEVLELLFVRDKIQRGLDGSAPEDSFPPDIYKLVHELDDSLWRERAIFLEVAGKEALQHARKRIRPSRSFWWWYLDELESVSEPSEGIALPEKLRELQKQLKEKRITEVETGLMLSPHALDGIRAALVKDEKFRRWVRQALAEAQT